jgi:deoxyribose-phosphate aldolase
VTGFPFGADAKEHKAGGAARAVFEGASEIDMVVNLGALKSGDLMTVAGDVAAVRRAVGEKVLKVILETGLLSAEETETVARVCMTEGADFLKTCTGYGPRGATVEDVEFLKRFGKVKASAGIRTFEQAAALVEAGAARLGTSATAKILGR